MKKISVYDFPTRIFHWLFAVLFVLTFAIAKTIDDENWLFSYHMLSGLTMGFLVLLRFVWGLIGTAYARFSSFKLQPGELIQYFRDIITSKSKRYPGHNPASSYAAIIIFLCIIGMATSGLLMATGRENELLEEIHELFSNLFLITVVAHLAGLFLHHLSHKDSLWSSMISGKKQAIVNESGIVDMNIVAGIILIVLSLSWFTYLNTNFKSNTQTLNFFGTELKLGEAENESGSEDNEEHEGHEKHEHEEHDDDDD